MYQLRFLNILALPGLSSFTSSFIYFIYPNKTLSEPTFLFLKTTFKEFATKWKTIKMDGWLYWLGMLFFYFLLTKHFYADIDFSFYPNKVKESR